MKNKPEVGQWWVNVVGDPPRVHKTGIVLFVGKDSKGRLLWEDCQGHIETDYGCDWSGWHHEPACTGWDWVPEVKESWKFVGKIMPKDVPDPAWVNAESPDDWVTQDRVPVRVGVDEFRYPTHPRLNEWRMSHDSGNWTAEAIHGFIDEDGDRLEVRCRRKDLPVVEETLAVHQSKLGRPEVVVFRRKATDPAKVATVTVYQILYGGDLNQMLHRFVIAEHAVEHLKHNWKYVIVVSTKTVEVML